MDWLFWSEMLWQTLQFRKKNRWLLKVSHGKGPFSSLLCVAGVYVPPGAATGPGTGFFPGIRPDLDYSMHFKWLQLLLTFFLVMCNQINVIKIVVLFKKSLCDFRYKVFLCLTETTFSRFSQSSFVAWTQLQTCLCVWPVSDVWCALCSFVSLKRHYLCP